MGEPPPNTFDVIMTSDYSQKRDRSESESSNESGRQLSKKHTSSVTRLVIISSNKVNISKLNPIKLDTALTNLVGKVERITLATDSIKVLCNLTQCNILRRAKKLLGYPITVKIQEFTIPGAKGIIHGVHLDITESDFLQQPDTHVTKINRLSKYDNESRSKEPTGTVILYFNTDTLPDRIFLGFQAFKVHKYIPPPTRCYKCQRYGHIATNCRSSVRCPNCGGSHDYKDCTSESVLCCHCGADHSAAYKGCPQYKETQEIQKYKVSNKVTFAEAVKQVKSQSSTPITNTDSTLQSTIPNAQMEHHNTPSTSPIHVSVNQIESVVHDIIDNTQLNHNKLYAQIGALILKIVSAAQDPTFWNRERSSRMQVVTSYINSIFALSLSSTQVQEQYTKITR